MRKISVVSTDDRAKWPVVSREEANRRIHLAIDAAARREAETAGEIVRETI